MTLPAADANTAGMLAALFQVVMIDLTLAGDNAVAVGLSAAGLPPDKRRWAIVLGLGGAALMLCGFAFVAVQLLHIVGLLLAGGLLLLWVSWRMWRELRAQHAAKGAPHAPPAKTLARALTEIFVADLSMSLDNVLAVAGAARDHPQALVIGLLLSVTLMGAAATTIARLMRKAPWLGYLGVAIVTFVAGHMIWDGALQVHAHVRGALPG